MYTENIGRLGMKAKDFFYGLYEKGREVFSGERGEDDRAWIVLGIVLGTCALYGLVTKLGMTYNKKEGLKKERGLFYNAIERYFRQNPKVSPVEGADNSDVIGVSSSIQSDIYASIHPSLPITYSEKNLRDIVEVATETGRLQELIEILEQCKDDFREFEGIDRSEFIDSVMRAHV